MAKNKKSKLDTKAIGLDVTMSLTHFVTGTYNMHYGLWDGLEVNLGNLGQAQTAYTEKLFRFMELSAPAKILDIGGGAGETAKALRALGHEVQIIVPSAALAAKAQEVAGTDVKVHLCRFEDFNSDEKFDFCLFSESFQYIDCDIALEKSKALLNPDGSIIVSDCFRTAATYADKSGKRRVGGGHEFAFYEASLERHALRIEKFEDITASVAPSVELQQQFYHILGDGLKATSAEMQVKKPFLRKVSAGFLKLIIKRKHRDRLQESFYENNRNASEFCLYNTYRMMKLVPAL